MKRIITTLVCVVAIGLPALGQGTVTFNNTASTLFEFASAGTDYQPTPVPFGGGYVQLLWAPAGTTEYHLFQPLGAQVAVSPLAGRFAGGVRTVPAGAGFTGISPGGQAAFLVRGWYGSALTWEQARDDAAVNLSGYTEPFILTTGDPTADPIGTPIPITAPGGFTGLLLAVPEPSALAMVGLGATALGLFRRRK